MKKIHVLLADYHTILREGLRVLLHQEPDIEVVAEADSGRETVRKSLELLPEVIIMEMSMQDQNGMDTTRELKAACPGIQVICLSAHRTPHFIMSMLEAGASGYLVKTISARELIAAVRTVVSGQTYLSPSITKDFVTHNVQGKNGNGSQPSKELTSRELEVLQLIAQGLHTSEIARRLCISPKTVLAHRHKIMDKLGLGTPVALVRHALHQGLIEPLDSVHWV